MNLFEWRSAKSNQFKEAVKADLLAGADFEDLFEQYPAITGQLWDQVAAELDAEGFCQAAAVNEDVDVTRITELDHGILEFYDFKPAANGKKYSVAFVAEASFVNSHMDVITKVQESLFAEDVEFETEEGVTVVLFAEAKGEPVLRRATRVYESPLSLFSIDPTQTSADVKRNKVINSIYGNK